MTGAQHRELELIRFRIEQLCRRRELEPFLGWEAQLYEHLLDREAQLLSVR